MLVGIRLKFIITNIKEILNQVQNDKRQRK